MEKGGSKLMQMQARYHQKQMQEREQKIASLYEAQQARALERVRHSPSDSRDSRDKSVNRDSRASPPHPPVPSQPGKVRQMFEERRTKGIDKSYPLQPIQNTDRTRKPLPNGYTKVTSTKIVENGSKTSNTRIENGNKANTRVENGRTVNQTAEKKSTKTSQSHSISWHNVKKQHTKSETVVNRSGDLNHNHQPDLNAVKEALLQSNGEPTQNLDVLDSADYRLEDETFPEALAPAATPRSPARPERPPRRSPAKAAPAPAPAPAKPPAAPAAPPRRAHTNTNTVSETKKAPGAMQRTANPAPIPRKYPTGVTNRRTASSSSSSAGGAAATGAHSAGAACAVCGRTFAPDRLAKHQDICRRAHSKKRKPFDALKHRLAGTEAEPFIGKLRKGAGAGAGSAGKPKAVNSNWRKKHEEFIQAIRAAKQVQQHLAAGGKLSDLPPPPPSENPDYVPCPHCGRRFNQAAADRHIPKCATFQFNKPKPQPSKRR